MEREGEGAGEADEFACTIEFGMDLRLEDGRERDFATAGFPRERETALAGNFPKVELALGVEEDDRDKDLAGMKLDWGA